MYNFEFVHPLKRLAILRSVEINHKNVENCRSLFKKKTIRSILDARIIYTEFCSFEQVVPSTS